MIIGKIEKGLPVPKIESKYPFAMMDIGDCFKVTGSDRKDLIAIYNRVKAAAHIFGKRNGYKFTIRKQKDFVRVWKIS